MRRPLSMLPTSAATAEALPPSSAISRTTSSAASGAWSLMTTAAPCFASVFAYARPRPAPAPVITGTLFSTSPMLSSTDEFLERHGLVHPHIAGQTEHPLRDDVLQYLIGTARDTQARRIQKIALQAAFARRVVRIADQAELVLALDQPLGEILQPVGGHELADGHFGPGRLAARQCRQAAQLREAQALGLYVPDRQSLSEHRVIRQGSLCSRNG